MPIQWGPQAQKPQGQQQTPQGADWWKQQPGTVPGQGTSAKTSDIGHLSTSQLGDPSLGTGITFQANANMGGAQALQHAMSETNQSDVQAQNAMRDVLMQRLGDLQGQSSAQKGELDTQLQRGSNTQMDQIRRQTAGSGGMGNANYAGLIGNIGSQTANARAQGLLNINNNELQNTLGIGAGLQTVANEGMANQEFQNRQAGQYANALMNMGSGMGARDQNLAQNAIQQQQMQNSQIGQLGEMAMQGGMAYATGGLSKAPSLLNGLDGMSAGGAGLAPNAYAASVGGGQQAAWNQPYKPPGFFDGGEVSIEHSLKNRLKKLKKHDELEDYTGGGHVKGEEVVPGDDELNDIVHARLAGKEIVIPKSIAQHKNAPEMAAAFIKGVKSHKDPTPDHPMSDIISKRLKKGGHK